MERRQQITLEIGYFADVEAAMIISAFEWVMTLCEIWTFPSHFSHLWCTTNKQIELDAVWITSYQKLDAIASDIACYEFGFLQFD